jgi:hypothetical protein
LVHKQHARVFDRFNHFSQRSHRKRFLCCWAGLFLLGEENNNVDCVWSWSGNLGDWWVNVTIFKFHREIILNSVTSAHPGNQKPVAIKDRQPFRTDCLRHIIFSPPK